MDGSRGTKLSQKVKNELLGLEDRDLDQQAAWGLRGIVDQARTAKELKCFVKETLTGLENAGVSARRHRYWLAGYAVGSCPPDAVQPIVPLIVKLVIHRLGEEKQQTTILAVGQLMEHVVERVMQQMAEQLEGKVVESTELSHSWLTNTLVLGFLRGASKSLDKNKVAMAFSMLYGVVSALRNWAYLPGVVPTVIFCFEQAVYTMQPGSLAGRVAGAYLPVQRCMEILGIHAPLEIVSSAIKICISGAAFREDWQVRKSALDTLTVVTAAVQLREQSEDGVWVVKPSAGLELLREHKPEILKVLKNARYDKVVNVQKAAAALKAEINSISEDSTTPAVTLARPRPSDVGKHFDHAFPGLPISGKAGMLRRRSCDPPNSTVQKRVPKMHGIGCGSRGIRRSVSGPQDRQVGDLQEKTTCLVDGADNDRHVTKSQEKSRRAQQKREDCLLLKAAKSTKTGGEYLRVQASGPQAAHSLCKNRCMAGGSGQQATGAFSESPDSQTRLSDNVRVGRCVEEISESTTNERQGSFTNASLLLAATGKVEHSSCAATQHLVDKDSSASSVRVESAKLSCPSHGYSQQKSSEGFCVNQKESASLVTCVHAPPTTMAINIEEQSRADSIGEHPVDVAHEKGQLPSQAGHPNKEVPAEHRISEALQEMDLAAVQEELHHLGLPLDELISKQIEVMDSSCISELKRDAMPVMCKLTNGAPERLKAGIKDSVRSSQPGLHRIVEESSVEVQESDRTEKLDALDTVSESDVELQRMGQWKQRCKHHFPGKASKSPVCATKESPEQMLDKTIATLKQCIQDLPMSNKQGSVSKAIHIPVFQTSLALESKADACSRNVQMRHDGTNAGHSTGQISLLASTCMASKREGLNPGVAIHSALDDSAFQAKGSTNLEPLCSAAVSCPDALSASRMRELPDYMRSSLVEVAKDHVDEVMHYYRAREQIQLHFLEQEYDRSVANMRAMFEKEKAFLRSATQKAIKEEVTLFSQSYWPQVATIVTTGTESGRQQPSLGFDLANGPTQTC